MAKQAKRGSYTNEQKQKYVAMIEKGDKTQADVAREVGLSPQAIGGWIKTYGKDAVDPRRQPANSNQATANATRRAGGARRGRPPGSANKPKEQPAPQMRAAARSTGPQESAPVQNVRPSANIMDNPEVVIAERNYLRALVKAAGISPAA